MNHSRCLCIALLLTAVPVVAQLPPPAQGYALAVLEYPNSAETLLYGINDTGSIVGIQRSPGGLWKGFLYRNGQFVDINYPGSVTTFPLGINGRGEIVGTYGYWSGGQGDLYPFIYREGAYATLPEVPGAPIHTTQPWGINNSGQIVGAYVDPCWCTGRGFLYSDGGFTTINEPSMVNTNALRISDAGVIFGWGSPSDWSGTPSVPGYLHAFQLSPDGTYADFGIQGFNVQGAGMNSLGQMTGLMSSPTTGAHGFVYRHGGFETLDYPGSPYTMGVDINTAGTIVGLFAEAGSGLGHGFIATPGPRYGVCLLYDPAKAVKSGATIPIKLQLCDGNKNNLSSAGITLHAVGVTQVSTNISGPVQDAGNSNPDSDFRFDPTIGPGGGYIFNLKTTGMATGSYVLTFRAGSDPSNYTAQFQVK